MPFHLKLEFQLFENDVKNIVFLLFHLECMDFKNSIVHVSVELLIGNF